VPRRRWWPCRRRRAERALRALPAPPAHEAPAGSGRRSLAIGSAR